jgi:hypothetical protein
MKDKILQLLILNSEWSTEHGKGVIQDDKFKEIAEEIEQLKND